MKTSPKSVKDLVTQMARDVLGDPLKEAGFRRTGRTFWRNRPDVCHLVIVCMSRWGTRDEGSFGLELGVYWHQVERILRAPREEKMPPRLNHCTFQISMCHTVPGCPRVSWDVTPSTDYSKIGKSVLKDLFEYGLPWLEYRSELAHVLDWTRYRRSEGPGRYSSPELGAHGIVATVFKSMLGRKSEARSDLQRLAAEGSEARAKQIGKRLGIL